MKLQKVSHLSAFVRPDGHLTRQTYSGALVTICGTILALTLFLHEVQHFYKQNRVVKVTVDMARRQDMDINIDMTLNAVPCAVLSVFAMDIAGTFAYDSTGLQLHKHRVDAQGRKIGRTEYHAPPAERIVDTGFSRFVTIDVQEAIKHVLEAEEESAHHEGCRFFGTVRVRRVAGRLVAAAQRDSVLDLLPASALLGEESANLTAAHTPHLQALMNMTHQIHHLSFGPRIPGMQNPLDGQGHVVTRTGNGSADVPSLFKYFLKVVPTEYYGRLGRVVETHQYAVSEFVAPLPPGGGRLGAAPVLPAVEFHFDLSPIIISINERPPSLLHFLVRLCAVVGGAVAITGLFDRLVQMIIRLVTSAPSSASSAAGGATPTSKSAAEYDGQPVSLR